MEQQKMNQQQQMSCLAEGYGQCIGSLTSYAVKWLVQPNECNHAAYIPVCICADHHRQIINEYSSKTFPEVYGATEAEALKRLLHRLHYTGLNPTYCEHCNCREKVAGVCDETCVKLVSLYADWECLCNKPVECVCASFENNPLHWAILTHVNGFDYDNYDCNACIQPCWRDTHEFYAKGLVDKEAIVAIAQRDPKLIYQKNAQGKSPLMLIPELIDSLLLTIEGEYLKHAEYRWARCNSDTLQNIQKELMVILDAYAN